MPEVWIVVDAEVDATGELAASSPTTTSIVAALKQSITSDSATISTVRVLSLSSLDYADGIVQRLDSKEVILCPLTLDIPTSLPFPDRRVYEACHNAIALRYLVEQKFGYATNSGSYWLPIVLTQKGPLYAEAIGLASEVSEELQEDLSRSSFSYYQPVHLPDSLRQPLYELGHRLLKFLEAPPATYLLQFGFEGKNIWFDRLWPFPAAPAIASVGVQSPDLFTCHWHCLAGLPIFDLTIIPKSC